MGPSTSSREQLYHAVELRAIERLEQDDSMGTLPQVSGCINSLTPREIQNLPIQEDRPRSFLWALVLLTPVAASFGILQLAFRNLYWRDAQRSGTSELLGVLQVAAKTHEILIVYSLSQVVLHHLQRLLRSASGMPLGFFSSGYSNTLGQPPIAFGFWSALASTFWRRKHLQWKTFMFGILVLLSTLIGLTSGPASAIALIPQLKWWHWSDLFRFANGDETNACFRDGGLPEFSMYMSKTLFPSEIDVMSLPGASCLNATTNDTISFYPY